MRIFVLCSLVLLLLGPVAAHADTYQYTAVYSDAYDQASVTFDLSSIPTIFTYVPPSDFVSSSTSANYYDPGDFIDEVDFDPLASDYCTGDYESCFIFFRYYEYSLPLFFDGVNFTTPGVYTDSLGDGTLTITDITPTPVPEPGSFALLGTGMFALFSLYRHNRLSAAEPPL